MTNAQPTQPVIADALSVYVPPTTPPEPQPLLANLIASDLALARKLIANYDDNERLVELTTPYVRITDFYAHYERNMLAKAVRQLAGCDILVVEFPAGACWRGRRGESCYAIYRTRHQINPIPCEE